MAMGYLIFRKFTNTSPTPRRPIATVMVLRMVLHVALLALLGVSIRREVLERHNPAWGVLDGGLIFALFLILSALIV